jgi:hypothetical protein
MAFLATSSDAVAKAAVVVKMTDNDVLQICPSQINLLKMLKL